MNQRKGGWGREGGESALRDSEGGEGGKGKELRGRGRGRERKGGLE